jgi:hypothetical protein
LSRQWRICQIFLSYIDLHGNLHPLGYYQEAGDGSNIFGRSLIHALICNGIYTISCMKRGITLDLNSSRGEMVGVLFYACFDKSRNLGDGYAN